MTAVDDAIAAAISDAQRIFGPFRPPEFFVQRFYADLESDQVSGPEDRRQLWHEIRDEFGYLWANPALAVHLAEESRNRGVNLLAWLLATFPYWRADDPHSFAHVQCMLFLVTATGASNVFWGSVNLSEAENASLFDVLARFSGDAKISLGIAPQSRPKDAQAMSQFSKADEDQEWPTLASLLRRMADLSIIVDATDTVESTKALFIHSRARLVRALNQISQTAVGLIVVKALPEDDSLELAVQTTSTHYKFAVAFATLSNRNRPLSGSAEVSLSNLLCQIAQDPHAWAGWMKVFNSYPPQYPMLSKPLGIALASAPTSALAIYIESINLNLKPGSERNLIAACLAEFQSRASEASQSSLWDFAYARWKSWDFAKGQLHSFLQEPTWSSLDFAVSSYFRVNLSPEQRMSLINEYRYKIRHVERDWYPTIMECQSEANRLVSGISLLYHAHLFPHSNCLQNESRFFFPDESGSPYFQARFEKWSNLRIETTDSANTETHKDS